MKFGLFVQDFGCTVVSDNKEAANDAGIICGCLASHSFPLEGGCQAVHVVVDVRALCALY